MAQRFGTVRLLLGGAVVVALLIAVGAYFAVRTQAAHTWLESRISAAVGPEVRFASVEPTLWPVPGAVLRDVSIAGDGVETLTAPSLRATIRLAPLLGGSFELATVELEQPNVQVELGSDALPKAETPFAMLLETLAPPDAPRTRLPDVELTNATLQVSGEVIPSGDPIDVSGLDLEFSEPEPDDVRGTLRADQVTIAGLAASTFQSSFALAGHELTLDGASFTAYGGTFEGKADLALGESTDFGVDMKVHGVDAQQLFRILAGRDVQVGFERLDARAQLTGKRTAAWRQSLAGSGSAAMRGGEAPSSSILMAVWNAIVPQLGGLLRPIAKPTRLEELHMPFELAAARLHTDELSLRTSDFGMHGHGSIGLDGSLDLDAEVRFTPAGIEKMLIMTSLPTSTANDPSLPPIPTKITGTLSHPHVRPDSSALAPFQALFAGAAEGAGQVGSKVYGAVRSGVGALEAFAGEAARKVR